MFWHNLLEFEIAIFFASSRCNDAFHGGRAGILPEESVAWMLERLKNVKLLRKGDRLYSHQIDFPKVWEEMLKDTSAPQGLQNTLVFPQTPLSNSSSYGSIQQLDS